MTAAEAVEDLIHKTARIYRATHDRMADCSGVVNHDKSFLDSYAMIEACLEASPHAAIRHIPLRFSGATTTSIEAEKSDGTVSQTPVHPKPKNQLSIYVPQEQQKSEPIVRLATLAERRDRKINFLVVEAILEYLDREIPLEDTPIKTAANPREGEATNLVRANAPQAAREIKAAQPKTVLDPAVVEQLTDVLSMYFANGYRLNSPIEKARFRLFFAEGFGMELELTDEELESYIPACGRIFDGKVYAVSVQAKERIKELAENYFADGAQAIFYAEFYAKNENWLFEASVTSEGMLIDILRRLFQELAFTQTYFGYTNASVFSALESEILRVWNDDILLTYDQLAERLQYVPLERIKYALGQNGDFIWSTVETFSHISRIDIADEERDAIRKAAVRECNAGGYVSITDLPFGEIEHRNYKLSITAVHNAIYQICLSDKLDKKGKIVARKGDDVDALTIMKRHCRSIEKCSLKDLLTYEKELTGKSDRWISMEAGNCILVRIDKDSYLADSFVHFKAELIDEAIELFIKGDYLPLKSFTTFAAFPDCGQAWSLFLLESYCRRFSRKFRFDTLSINSRNAGAVIRNSCGMDYTEIMTDAVANADVSLEDTVVSKFLYESGYTGRSTTARVIEIIDKAMATRERMD
jgi:hypothetical protein